MAALLALAACDLVKVEQTPRGFYTQRDPARIDQQDAASELRARVRNFADELGRGNSNRALAALNPTEDVLVMGTGASDGVARIGRRGLALALDSLAIATPAVARPADLRVQVGLRETTGWFSTPIQFMAVGSGEPPQWLRASGVYTHDRGEWKLVQLHLSRPYAQPDTARADSTARGDSAGATRRDSARAASPPPQRPAQPRSRSPE
ncbi:MAG TPA: nuclear transport factor 2 family protein [Longimicrobium sp.]|nr:nuclear transport factor 2 family protein [Longimicrobium sp.]